MSITTEHADAAATVPLRPITLGWALKRALLGIVILVVAMGGVAWLTYASIDPDLEQGDQAKTSKAMPTMGETQVRL